MYFKYKIKYNKNSAYYKDIFSRLSTKSIEKSTNGYHS